MNKISFITKNFTSDEGFFRYVSQLSINNTDFLNSQTEELLKNFQTLFYLIKIQEFFQN
jgi:hypothetical protein